jgi:hypothetical protein
MFPWSHPQSLVPYPDGVTPTFVQVGADPSDQSGPGLDLPIGSVVRYGTTYLIKCSTQLWGWARIDQAPFAEALPITSSVAVGATTVTIASGLDGDTDGGHEIEAYIVHGGVGSADYEMQPNGLTTNQRWMAFICRPSAGSIYGGEGASTWRIGQRAFAGGYTWIRARVFTIAGRKRVVFSEFQSWTAAGIGANAEIGFFASVWDVTNTNLSSYVVRCTAASGIGAGSRFTVRKLGRMYF